MTAPAFGENSSIYSLRIDMMGNTLRSRLGALSLIVLAVSACWILPLRQIFGPDGSYYNFGHQPDEYAYAIRMSPLPVGANVANPYNGVGDADAFSPLYIEDGLRILLSLLHMDVPLFFWIYRFVYPVALAVLFYLLCTACMGRVHRPWAGELHCLFTAVALTSLYLLYHVLSGPWPIYCFINRIPTNLEYLFSLAVMNLLVRLAAEPVPRLSTGMLLMAAGAGFVYLRPFTAWPWAIVTALWLPWSALRGRLSWKMLGAMVALFCLLLAPWIAISLWNRHSQAYQDLLGRMFQLPFAYRVHPQAVKFVSLAAVLLAASFFLQPRCRALLRISALTLGVMPFLCGAIYPVASELVSGDRFPCFHLVLLLAAALLLAGDRMRRWRGRVAPVQARRLSRLAGWGALCAISAMAWLNWRYEFFPAHEPYAHSRFVAQDLRYHAAYRWVKEHTPPQALFIVDDGYDWSRPPIGYEATDRLLRNFRYYHNDLFLLIARRRQVYSEVLYGQLIRNVELTELTDLQFATFGFPGDEKQYIAGLKKYRPEFIFWRKTAPVFAPTMNGPIPRGFGTVLKPLSRTVYSDDVCEIWELDLFGAKGFARPPP